MPLTNTQFRYYDSTVLRLPANKRTEYHKQVDRLIGELSRRIRDRTEITITKVVKAGFFAKFTILRKTSEDPVDVDLVFYVAGRSIEEDTLETLNEDRRRAFREHWESVKNRPPLVSTEPLVP